MSDGTAARPASDISVLDEPNFALNPGDVVDHYEVVRHIGSGGMASVYLARDAVLGRRVALKCIDGHKLPGDFSVEAFVTEARTLAQFNHPNIVTVFGVERHGARAYIAMEYVEGQPLRHRVEEDGVSIREAQRICLAIASGLAEAHAAQILHGDLKPENIVIAKDGRLRILDFGLAKLMSGGDTTPVAATPQSLAGSAADLNTLRQSEAEKAAELEDEDSLYLVKTGLKGTPAYMAPEQWSGEKRTLAVDIWALGVIMFELVRGRRPFLATDLLELANTVGGDQPAPTVTATQEIPEQLADLINRCLQKNPGQRPSAGECASVLSLLVHGGAFASGDADASPFRGLAAFGEEHASYFFGREDETDAFIERVRTDPILPIVGASGVGKSSFIQAGVIPRLREMGNWHVVRLRPGAEPFRTLASRLVKGRGSSKTMAPGQAQTEPVSQETLAQELRENPKALSIHLRRHARENGGRVLLLVDQLEEVCTLVADHETRLRFLAAICTAADDPSDPVRVVFTVRDDFLTRVAESPEARAALTRVTVLRAPGKEALSQILTRPLQVAGYRYDDPSLVDTMIHAVADESSALPLLQFTGSMLWERRNRQDKVLTTSAYTSLGGVQGALATHADAFMRELSEAQAQLVRDMMLRLVTPDGTRRVTSKRALVEALGGAAEEVILRLTQSRLVSVRDVLEEPHLELSHESLVLTWDRLRTWLEQGREELVFLAELEQAAALWEKRGRRRSEVWTGDSFTEAQRQLDRFRSRLPELTQARPRRRGDSW